MPESIYYCISGQLSLWLISLFGSTAAVAQVGALSRFSAALTVLQSMATMLLVPRFARLGGSFRSNLSKFLGIELSLFLAGTAIVAVCALVPGPLLSILGHGYEGLTTGLLLAVAAGSAHMVSGTTHQLLASRGLVVPAKLYISLAIASQCLIVFLLKPHDVNSVFLLSLLTTASAYLIRIGYLAWHLARHEHSP